MLDVFVPTLLQGRRALITGGATGIGFSIARMLGGLGAEVLIASRNAGRPRTGFRGAAGGGDNRILASGEHPRRCGGGGSVRAPAIGR